MALQLFRHVFSLMKRAKVVVAIAKGKKEYDKRDSIKERDDRREMDRAFKRN